MKLEIRKMTVGDLEKGLSELLERKTGKGMTKEKLEKILSFSTIVRIVAEDTNVGKIVGMVSLLFEQKMVMDCSVCCYLNDVIMSEEYEQSHLYGQILDIVIKICKERKINRLFAYSEQELGESMKKKGFKSQGQFYQKILIEKKK